MNAADNQPVTSNVAKSLRVFRYRNARTRAHAFTTELASRQRLPSSFIREDIPESITSSPFLYAYTEQHTSTVPIYRFRAPKSRFGGSRAARFIYDRKVEGSSEVFRIVNPRDSDILFTASPEEKNFYRKQAWTHLSSLGFAQSTSSSGTGILRDTTVKLESDDLQLVSPTDKRGQKIVFRATNSKIGSLVPRTIVYSEKKSVFPLGLVAKVRTISQTSAEEIEVETVPAELLEALVEFHLYLENRQAYFVVPEVESELAATVGPPPLGGEGLRSASVSQHSADESTANASSATTGPGQPEETRSGLSDDNLRPSLR